MICPKCGKEVEDTAVFCPECGTELGVNAGAGDATVNPEEGQAESQAEPQSDENTQTAGEKFHEFVSDSLNTEDKTAEFDAQDINDNKVMAILAYLSWLVIIPLLAAPKSKFARFHTNQGLVLAIAEIALCVGLGIIQFILNLIFLMISWRLADIFSVLFGIIWAVIGIGSLALSIIGIVNAAQGTAKELPIVGKFKILK